MWIMYQVEMPILCGERQKRDICRDCMLRKAMLVIFPKIIDGVLVKESNGSGHKLGFFSVQKLGDIPVSSPIEISNRHVTCKNYQYLLVSSSSWTNIL